MKKILFLFLISVYYASGQGASPLLSGPMQGYLEMKESVIWLQTKHMAKVYAHYDDLNTPLDEGWQTNTVVTRPEEGHTAKLYFTNLKPGHTYRYKIFIDDVQVERPFPFEFTTPQLWHKLDEMPEVRLALASCFYLNDPAEEPAGKEYGGEYGILGAILEKEPTTMLWLGDNVYLQPADWWSRSGYIDRYTKMRSLPELQELLASCPHFAIWDDHDYGPNDANGSWVMKETALDIFKLFWVNHSYGYEDVPGIMSGFQIEDIPVIMLDNRYHRTEQLNEGEEQVLGKSQIDRLINLLKYSRSPYKLVAVGGQVLNSARVYENHANYEDERAYLLQRISEEEITGVVFLSGDRHHSEVMKYESGNGTPIWEFTTSPLTSGPNTNVTETNDHRIDGSLIQQRNFSILSISGERGERKLEITYYSSKGKKLYQYGISQKDTEKTGD
jgi:alkaline phosphatase D